MHRSALSPRPTPVLLLLLLLLLVCLSLLFSLVSSKLLSSRSETAINGWTRAEPVPPSSPHSFTLALHQRNTDRLSSILDAVSDPTSASYQHFLTPQQLQDLTALPTSATDPIIHWLTTNGVPPSSIIYTPGAGAIQAHTTAEAVNALFGCRLYRWVHEDGREAQVAWGECHLPDEFAQAVELVLGLDFPPRIHHGPVRSAPQLHPPAEVHHTPAPRSTSPSPQHPLSSSHLSICVLCALLLPPQLSSHSS